MAPDDLSPDDIDKLMSKEDLFRAWLINKITHIEGDIQRINSKYDKLEKLVFIILSVIASMAVYAIFK